MYSRTARYKSKMADFLSDAENPLIREAAQKRRSSFNFSVPKEEKEEKQKKEKK